MVQATVSCCAIMIICSLFSCHSAPIGRKASHDTAASAAMKTLLDSAYAMSDRYDYRGSLTAVMQCEQQAREVSDSDMIAECLSHAVFCYHNLGQPDSAIIVGRQQIQLDSLLGDPIYLASDYSNLAAIFLGAGRPADARQYIDRAIAIELEIEESSQKLGIRYGLASEIYNASGQHEQALDYALKAYSIDDKKGDTILIGRRLCQVGDVQMNMMRYDDAEKAYAHAIKMLSSKDERHSLAIACRQMGTLYIKKGQLERAIPYLERALATSTQELRPQMHTYEKLYQAYRNTDKGKALHYHELYTELKDSLFTIESQKQLSQYHVQYESAEKDRRIEQGESRVQRMVIGGLLLGIIVIGVIGLLVSLLRLRNRQHSVLSDLERMRASFFTNITHEFRTPLTIIQGLADKHLQTDTTNKPETDTAQNTESEAQKTESEAQNTDSDTAQTDFRTIRQQSHELLSLVNQILDYSRISNTIGICDWRHGDVRPLLEMMAETHSLYAEQRGIIFSNGISHDAIEMDFTPDYMQKMVRNLLSNAIKYTEQGGNVFFSARSDGRYLVMRIADTGCGMNADDAKAIFQPFYTAANSYEKGSSTGVGLFLVHQIVKAMNGTIDVESAPGEGTVFTLRLPLHQENIRDIRPYVASEHASQPDILIPDNPISNIQPHDTTGTTDDGRPVILIAEDNAVLAQHISSLFADAYHVVCTHDGQEALEHATDIVPDIVLTDLMMPRMDGHELCRKMRSNPLLAHIPIIILTAKDRSEDYMAGLEDGALEYIIKPFDGRALRMRIDNVMRSIQLQRARYAQSASEGEAESELLGDVDKSFLDNVDEAILSQMRHGAVSPDTVADALCMSRGHLLRKIKAITGMTSTAYITRIRITYAKSLLDNPELSIQQVAMMSGYDEPSNFYRAFKSVTGVTPKQYRG